MKKLNLKNLKLDADDMLQREQLKTVFGGYSGGCWVMCGDGTQAQTGHCNFAGWACMPHGWTICTC